MKTKPTQIEKLLTKYTNNKIQHNEKVQQNPKTHNHRGCLGSQEPMGSWGLGSVCVGSHMQLKLGGLDVIAEAAWSLQHHHCHHLG